MIVGLFVGGAAFAGDVGLWRVDTFGPGPVSGTNGWETGFIADPWWGSNDAQVLSATTDLNAQDVPGGFGDGGAVDNWLIRGDSVRDGYVRAVLRENDNDTIGLVLSADGAGSEYLLGFSADSAPDPVGNARRDTWFLVEARGGRATELARVEAPGPADWTEVELAQNDGVLTPRQAEIRCSA